MSQVFQLKLDGVAFRLIPESAQVKNAIKVSGFLGQGLHLVSCVAALCSANNVTNLTANFIQFIYPRNIRLDLNKNLILWNMNDNKMKKI